MKSWKQNDVGVQHDSRRRQEYLEASNYCSDYFPCPINYECQNKAPHLYTKCANCPVPHAKHNHKVRSYMIRRENFGIEVTKETGEKFLQASRESEARLQQQ